MIEHKIGEVFEDCGKKIKAVIDIFDCACIGCLDANICFERGNEKQLCNSNERKDGKDIIFKEVK